MLNLKSMTVFRCDHQTHLQNGCFLTNTWYNKTALCFVLSWANPMGGEWDLCTVHAVAWLQVRFSIFSCVLTVQVYFYGFPATFFAHLGIK